MRKFLALLAVPVAGIAVVGWLMQPPADPKTDHVMGDTAGLAPGGPIAEVTLPGALSPEATMGKTFFEAKCRACHGENAAGTNGTAPPLIHPFYRSGHHSDEAFQRAAKLGVQQHHWTFGNMPPVEGLTVADVKYITRYVREMQAANGLN